MLSLGGEIYNWATWAARPGNGWLRCHDLLFVKFAIAAKLSAGHALARTTSSKSKVFALFN